MGRDSGDVAAQTRRIQDFYGVETLEGFGAFSRAEIAACALALAYVERTQLANTPDLAPPARRARSAHMEIDAATRANLELTRTLGGERQGSLLAAIDFTRTPAGARLLAERLASPLTDPQAIGARLDAVTAFVAAPDWRAALRGLLATAPDALRALARLSVDRGGPRDLAALRDGWGDRRGGRRRAGGRGRHACGDRARPRRAGACARVARRRDRGGARRRLAARQTRGRLRARGGLRRARRGAQVA